MQTVTKKFYRMGVQNQKRADISFDLRRAKQRNIMTWTPEQKALALELIEDCENKFQVFKQVLIDSLNLIKK